MAHFQPHVTLARCAERAAAAATQWLHRHRDFIAPPFRFPFPWGVAAFLIGAVALAWPLLRTSKLVRQGDVVMMQRSTAFFTVVLVLAAIRIVARAYFDRFLTVEQTGGIFFVLAFGMIVRWRVNMLLEYRRLTAQTESLA